MAVVITVTFTPARDSSCCIHTHTHIYTYTHMRIVLSMRGHVLRYTVLGGHICNTCGRVFATTDVCVCVTHSSVSKG